MEIIAHRGASSDAPENTLAAVNLGWHQNADAVEVDIQFTKDGKIVVIHDDTTKKTAGMDKPVGEQTLPELKALDVGRWKGRQWVGEKIPTLDEVLATVLDGKRLFIEMKCGPESIPEFEATLKRSGKKPEQIVPIGFSLPTMKLVKSRMPALEICWIVKCQRNWRTVCWTPTLAQLVRAAKDAGLDGLDLGANRPLNRTAVQTVKAAGLKLYIWTVDSAAKAKKLAEAGVDGITTNRPAWLREKLGQRSI